MAEAQELREIEMSAVGSRYQETGKYRERRQ
jgi:hypothetical protein